VRCFARARDNSGVARVDFLANGDVVGTATAAPFVADWNAGDRIGGTAIMTAVATDRAGNRWVSEQHSVTLEAGALPRGRESIYKVLNLGEIGAAEKLLEDVWDLGDRSEPAYLKPPLTWTEDPYNDSYWRFLFYSLRPTVNLLWAFRTTGDVRYRNKLVEILESYVDYDLTRVDRDRTRFDDKHASAFRAMVLVNSYFKLKAGGDLPIDLDGKLLKSILKLGNFLFDPTNFDTGYNHGFTEAAALLLIGANFDVAPPEWNKTALDRLESVIVDSVDDDGVEVEKSPFYHFYVATFANEIVAWSEANHVPLSEHFTPRTRAMSRFATYIPEPSGAVPLIGASVALDVRKLDPDVYGPTGQADPFFEYTWTGGVSGEEPTELHPLFPHAGFAILRSGFGPVTELEQQTHVVFNVGPYRTEHSHLDSLTLTYATNGKSLLPDSGLFTYDPGPDHDFFSSTRAHNTVVVDASDQSSGPDTVIGLNTSGTNPLGRPWSYQSGAHRLYSGVVHKRSVALLSKDVVLVIDNLHSEESHTYAQTWHFAPDVVPTTSGVDVTGRDATGSVVSLHQALGEGIAVRLVSGATDPIQGWFSEVYGQKEPNWVAEYEAKANDARFVTLITSGAYAAAPVKLTANGDDVGEEEVVVCAGDLAVTVSVSRQVPMPGDSAIEAVHIDDARGACSP
jgi:hypothetical protein